MLATLGVGIAAVGHAVAVGGQKVGLRLVRPALALKEPGITMVVGAHFLQANQIGIELGHALAQGVNLQALGGTCAAHALVDVVGRDAQRVALGGLHPLKVRAHGLTRDRARRVWLRRALHPPVPTIHWASHRAGPTWR